MSLVICPDCSQKVSSSADACPHCGFPIAGQIKNLELKLAKRRGFFWYINSPLKFLTFALTLALILAGFVSPLNFLVAVFPGFLWLLLNVDKWF